MDPRPGQHRHHARQPRQHGPWRRTAELPMGPLRRRPPAPHSTQPPSRPTPDKKLFYPLEDKVRSRYFAALGIQSPPATLAEYLAKVVTPTLEAQHKAGAVSEKFEIAYLRGFDFTDPSPEEAARIYTQHAPHPGRLQAVAGLPLPLHRHRVRTPPHGRPPPHPLRRRQLLRQSPAPTPCCSNPSSTTPNCVRRTSSCSTGAGPLSAKPARSSRSPTSTSTSRSKPSPSPRAPSPGWLREWLETYPEKVLFGTDGYALSDAEGWEEATWIASRNGRQALGLALTGMVEDGEITRPRAMVIADQVLRTSAERLYSLGREAKARTP